MAGVSNTWPITLGLALLQVPLVAAGTAWYARKARAGQYIRPEGPQTHAAKAGTPTMAGMVPLIGLVLVVGLAAAVGVRLTVRTAFVFVACGAGASMGLVDDLLSQRGRRSQGIPARVMLPLQVLAACGLYGLTFLLPQTPLLVPFSQVPLSTELLPSWAVFLLVIVAYPAVVNAVNMSDGLDGLASGCVVLVLLGALPLVAYSPDLVALVVLGVASCIGFLWVNSHPAGAFLGNVGSMGLGGLLFGVYYAGGALLLLPLMGGFLVAEVVSVMAQVASFKLTGRRLLRMAPLHHHLEEGPTPFPHWIPGAQWAEPQVVTRLWTVCALCVVLGLIAWQIP